MHKRSILPLASLLLLLALLSCASISTPSGGPRDEEPPRFVHGSPQPGAVNVRNTRMRITFNEIVNVKDPFNKVVVSPVTAMQPKITAQGKSILVDLGDSLLTDATYTIDFGDAIEDNNEGNKLTGFTYLFSTGPVADTLRISGMVLDARTLEPQQGMLVGIHSLVNDTTFQTKRFERVAKTDDMGRFSVRGLKEGTYRIFALGDLNNDYRWDNPEETIAFADYDITPSSERLETVDSIYNMKTGKVDSTVRRMRTRYLPNNVLLSTFNLNYKASYLAKSERIDSTRISLIFNAPLDSLPEVSLVGFPDLADWHRLDRNATNDTLTYWITDPQLIRTDTLFAALRYPRSDKERKIQMVDDTVRLLTNRPRAPKKPKKLTAADSLNMIKAQQLEVKTNISSVHDIYNPITVEFGQPLASLDTTAFHMEIKRDTVWLPARLPLTIRRADSISERRYRIEYPWSYGDALRLTVDTLAATGIYGNQSAPLKSEFTIKKAEEYGSIDFKIEGMNPEYGAFVELLNTSDNVVRTAPVADGKATFGHLNPGTYYARVIEDRNSNGIYDNGSYDEARQPELASYYPKKINLKANWVLGLDWNVNTVALNLQKPLDIKKNKSEAEKKMTTKRTSEKDEDEEGDLPFDPNQNPFDPNSKNRYSRGSAPR